VFLRIVDNWIRKEQLLLCALLLSTVSECACIFFFVAQQPNLRTGRHIVEVCWLHN